MQLLIIVKIIIYPKRCIIHTDIVVIVYLLIKKVHIAYSYVPLKDNHITFFKPKFMIAAMVFQFYFKPFKSIMNPLSDLINFVFVLYCFPNHCSKFNGT